MARQRRFLLALIFAPLAAIAGFLLVGWLAARKEAGAFDWEIASIFGTAVGTVFLAVATGALALTTARDVTATQEIAKLTRQDREDRLHPIVMGTVKQLGSDEEGDFAHVELHNIGGGPAVRIEVTMECGGLSVACHRTWIPWLAAGSSLSVVLRWEAMYADRDRTFHESNFLVRGNYLDRLERPAAREIFDWLHDPASQ